MARLTQMIYRYLKIEAPAVIKTYIRRRVSGEGTALFDNSILALDIKNQLLDYDIKRIKKVLFVDDEIGYGITSRNCLDLLLQALNKEDEKIDFFVVAEDWGFKGFLVPSNVRIMFFPFSRKAGVNNAIMYMAPDEIGLPLLNLSKHVTRRFNVLLDLPSRDYDEPLSGFNYRLNQLAKESIPSLDKLKSDLEELIFQLIQRAIEEYESKVIDLND